MTFLGPLMPGHLLIGVARELDHYRTGGLSCIIEGPAGERLPEGIIPPFSFDEEFEEDDDGLMETDEEEPEDDVDWSSDSEDSGYESMSQEEEELEDHVIVNNVRPGFPLIQEQSPPGNLFTGLSTVFTRIPLTFPLSLPQPIVDSPHSFVHHSVESSPSSSGSRPSTKRVREESYAEQVSGKRQRWNSQEEPAHSVSAFSFFPNGSRADESYIDSPPSTSGLSSSTNGRQWPDPFECARWAYDSDSD